MNLRTALLALGCAAAAALAAATATVSTTTGWIRAAVQQESSDRPASTTDTRTYTLDHVKWVEVDSNGFITDYEYVEPGGFTTCSLPLNPAPPTATSANADLAGEPPKIAVTERTASPSEPIETLDHVKWVEVDALGIITQYAVYAPSNTYPPCYNKVSYIISPTGSWILVSQECMNPCSQDCYACSATTPLGTTMYWCVCSTSPCGTSPP